MARQPKGRPTIYLGKDGLFHCYYPIGVKSNGEPERKHIKRKSAAAVADAIDELEQRLKRGHGKLGKIETVADWLDHYLNVIVRNRVDSGERAESTYIDYETLCRNWIVPHLGHWRLSGSRRRLEPEHVEALYAAMNAAGKAGSYIVRVHRVLSRALKLAYRRGRADRNVMELVDAPEYRAKKVKALSQADAQAVLTAALRDDMAARWALGILAGPRQGEVLGLRWSRVELDPEPPDVPHIKPEVQLQRRSWRHGCADPVACVASLTDAQGQPRRPCRVKPCPPKYEHGCERPCGRKLAHFCPQRQTVPGCSTHKAEHCPPLCPPDCAGHAKLCPQRVGGGLVEVRLKTEASEEPMALGKVVTELLRQHRENQIRQRAARSMDFDPEGFVFAQPNGKPIDPRRDYQAWCDLLARAKVKHYRLHAARHTTATFLRATGADLRMVQDVLRQADLTMAGRYVDVAMEARQEALDRVAAALMDGDLSKIMGAQRVA